MSTNETDQTFRPNTCTDCNKTFKTLSSYKAHRTKFHKNILKASVAKGKPVYQNGLQTQILGGGQKDLSLLNSSTDLIEQQRKDLRSGELSEIDDLILKQGMEIISKNLS